jgi:hypothetical protein
MTNYVINIDKLKLIFNNENVDLKDKNGFEFIIQTDNKYSITHQKNILIRYRGNDFCFLLHKNKLRPSSSKLSVLNRSLYIDDFNLILIKFLSHFNIIDYTISTLEVSINSNKKITRNYYTYYFNKKIVCKKGFESFSYVPTENRFTNIVLNDTIYIKKNKSPIEIRIENKTNEIKLHSNKQYILNYYNQSGLTIDKDIYRLEMKIDLVNLRRSSRYTQYQNNSKFDDIISEIKFSKLSYLEQGKYGKVSISNPYQIEIDNLSNEDYLISLFDYFSPFNYEILIKPKTKIQKIKFENRINKTKSTTSTKKVKNEYMKEFDDIINLFE